VEKLMAEYTRRYALTRAFPGLVLTTLLAACGVSPRSSSEVFQDTPHIVVTRPSAPAIDGTATADCVPIKPMLTRPATPTVLRPEQCAGPVAERKVYSFADKVRDVADLVLLGMVRDILPARRTTLNGQRPNDPKSGSAFIFTPVRVAIETSTLRFLVGESVRTAKATRAPVPGPSSGPVGDFSTSSIARPMTTYNQFPEIAATPISRLPIATA